LVVTVRFASFNVENLLLDQRRSTGRPGRWADAFPVPDLDVSGIDQANIEQAWRQLRRGLPQVELPEAAELLLERYAWSRFEEGGPTNPVEPSPSRSPTPSSGVAGHLDVSSTATSDPSHTESGRGAGTAEAADA
jgi:hypothetical protein